VCLRSILEQERKEERDGRKEGKKEDMFSPF
jgi:hypothetical protein